MGRFSKFLASGRPLRSRVWSGGRPLALPFVRLAAVSAVGVLLAMWGSEAASAATSRLEAPGSAWSVTAGACEFAEASDAGYSGGSAAVAVGCAGAVGTFAVVVPDGAMAVLSLVGVLGPGGSTDSAWSLDGGSWETFSQLGGPELQHVGPEVGSVGAGTHTLAVRSGGSGAVVDGLVVDVAEPPASSTTLPPPTTTSSTTVPDVRVVLSDDDRQLVRAGSVVFGMVAGLVAAYVLFGGDR